jgi:hypothetical protein
MITETLKNCDPRVFRIVNVYTQTGRSGSEASDVRSDVFGEQGEYFTLVCVAPGFAFAVDLCAVNGDIKDALTAGHQPEILDDVLIVGEKVLSHAHGVG